MWVAGKGGEHWVSTDPISRTGPQWVYVNPWRRMTYPFNTTMMVVNRDQLVQHQANHPAARHVYITEGHYDDHADQVVNYVKNGGGLIIAGHAWFWASQRGRQECVLLNHPGNRIVTHFGIAFSRDCVEGRVARHGAKISR